MRPGPKEKTALKWEIYYYWKKHNETLTLAQIASKYKLTFQRISQIVLEMKQREGNNGQTPKTDG